MIKRVVVVTSCTGVKAPIADGLRLPAEDLYRGEQHRRLMRGIQTARASLGGDVVEPWILSAQYGLVRGAEPIAPYDATFAGMSRSAIRDVADRLDVRRQFTRIFATPYDLGVILLGDDYLHAVGIDDNTRFGNLTVAFCGMRASLRLGGIARLRVVGLSPADTRRFNAGLVGLKGELGARLLDWLSRSPEALGRLNDGSFDLLGVLEDSTEASQLPMAA
jgi:hypothetical protein